MQTNKIQKHLIDWQEIKDLFELDPAFIHLGLGMLSPHPKPVRESIENHRRAFDRNPILYHKNIEKFENETLASASTYLNTPSTQIALTESTTVGLGLVLSGIRMRPGEEILATEHEHYAADELLRFKEKREGIVARRIRLYSESALVTEESILKKILQGISEKTRLILLTWVHSSTGVKLPLKKISEAVEEVNHFRSFQEKILIAVDGVHGFGVEDFEIEDLGCDFFITGCHKWLFGPRGTGLVWGTEEAWSRIIPIIPSFKGKAFFAWLKGKSPEAKCPQAWLSTPGGFNAFEHRFALKEAFELHLKLGKKTISERTTHLATCCKKELTSIPSLKLHTPMDSRLSSGIICFEIEGTNPGSIVDQLIKKGVLSGQTPYRQSYCRFTPSIFNSEEEIQSAANALREIADT